MKKSKQFEQFAIDNEFQRRLRDEILLPLFYDKFWPNHYITLDGGNEAETIQNRDHVDTLVQQHNGDVLAFEEKIVRWPHWEDGSPKDKPHSKAALETYTNTTSGRRKLGWSWTSKADSLLFCFANVRGTALDCYKLNFGRLRHWFWTDDKFKEFDIDKTDQINQSEYRLVPIIDMCENAGYKRYYLDGAKGTCQRLDLKGRPIA